MADIIHPYNAGGNNLYSVEYFNLAARALAPDGIMVQWVPLEDPTAHRLIIRTFLEAFPNATLWLSTDVLVGGNQPLEIERERVTDAWRIQPRERRSRSRLRLARARHVAVPLGS